MIRFEFNGGPKDGEIVVHDGGSGKGKAYAELTEDGRPGKILWCTTDYFMDVAEHLSDSALRDLSEAGVPLRGHLYEARVRWHLNPGFRVKLRHVGVCPSLERRTDVLQDNNSILESL